MACYYIKVSDEAEIQEMLDKVKCDYIGQVGVSHVLLSEAGKYEDRIHSGDTRIN
jgi:hypothetical protein